MHATMKLEQNGPKELLSKGTMTPLDSTTIYSINPIIFHPLITSHDWQNRKSPIFILCIEHIHPYHLQILSWH